MSPVVRLRTLFPLFILLASLLLTPPPLNAREQKAPPPPATVVPLVSVPSFPGLAAKAPGAPGYGLQVTSSTGKYMLTGMSYDPITHKPAARLGRIIGPAGMGPYRLGVKMGFSPQQAIPENHLNPCWYDNYFIITEVVNGSPAQRAGLNVKDFWVIRSVDGSNFGWDVNALIWHISNSPEVEISAERPGAFFCSKKTFRIKTSKLETPVDPADGNLEAVQEADADAEVKVWIKDNKTWKDLLILRSQTDKFAPLALDLAGRKLWVVRVQIDPSPQEKTSRPESVLEFWKEDPRTGPFDTGILDVWQEPEDGLQTGRDLRIEDRWYRLQALTQDPTSGRLTSFDLRPWEADINSLLSGVSMVKELGPQKTSALQEPLEHTANDALVEWKTRTLPGLLKTQDTPALEDLVIRTEKGLLDLDLEIRGMRQRLDDLARAKAAQQAQASMPGGNQTAPAAASAASTADSEALADLLDQRKAILQAILGSTKQALAQVRR